MKTITRILTLVLVLAMFACTATTAFAASDDGSYVTLDTVVKEFTSGYTYHGKTVVTVGDLFTSGTIGSAESSGYLDIDKGTADSVTWTLKDGVCILTAHPEKTTGTYTPSVSAYVGTNSPLWNNEHIETVIVDSRISALSLVFKNGLPNLKTVIILGNTLVGTAGGLSAGGKVATGEFPSSPNATFIYEDWRKYPSDKSGRPCIAVTNNKYDFENGTNKLYDSRAEYLADAAPILASATLNADAVAMLPADVVNAVNAIGGFASLGGNPASAGETTPKSGNYICHDWAAEEVKASFNIGIGNDIFGDRDLTKNITRAEYAHIVVQAYEAYTHTSAPYDAVNPFTDTEDIYVRKAAALGIVGGYGNGKFGPSDLLTREQMATMCVRFAAKCGLDLPAGNGTNPFTDTISDWALDSVLRCSNNGIVGGYGNGRFGAGDNLTCEQAIAVCLRTYNRLGA